MKRTVSLEALFQALVTYLSRRIAYDLRQYDDNVCQLTEQYALLMEDHHRLNVMIGTPFRTEEVPLDVLVLLKQGLDLRLQAIEDERRRLQCTERHIQHRLDQCLLLQDVQHHLRAKDQEDRYQRLTDHLEYQQRVIALQRQEIDFCRLERVLYNDTALQLRSACSFGSFSPTRT